MKYKIMTAAGLAGSALASLLGGWDKFLETLLIFMAVDWLTGGVLLPAVFRKSPKSANGALESHAGWKGLCRKAMTLFYVAKHVRKRSGGPFLSFDRGKAGPVDEYRVFAGCGMNRIYCK